MPSEMFERGRRDAEADALDENYYQYYYDYKLAYDEVMRNHRRTRRQLMLGRGGRLLLRTLPILLLLVAASYASYRYIVPAKTRAGIPTPTRTPRPTLVPPTPRPAETPTLELALRPGSFAMVTGTDGAALLARKGPGKDKPVVARFPEGTTVKLIEGPQSANDLQWWRIELEGKTGWSAAPFLKPVKPPTPANP